MRPTWFEFPTDTLTFELQNQFMLGDAFLIAPKLRPEVKSDYKFFSWSDADKKFPI